MAVDLRSTEEGEVDASPGDQVVEGEVVDDGCRTSGKHRVGAGCVDGGDALERKRSVAVVLGRPSRQRRRDLGQPIQRRHGKDMVDGRHGACSTPGATLGAWLSRRMLGGSFDGHRRRGHGAAFDLDQRVLTRATL